MSKIKTWMPVYIGDYLADTMRLTTLQHGAYFLLMMEYWRQGPLPADMDELAAIARTDRKVWDKSIWPTLKRFFSTEDDGMLHQKRADKELAHAQSVSNKRRDAVQQRRDRSNAKGMQNDNKEPTNVDTKVGDLNIQKTYKEGDTRTSCASASPSPSQLHSSLRSEDVGCNAPDAPAENSIADRWRELGEEVIAASGCDPSRSCVSTGVVRQWLADAQGMGYGYDGAREIILAVVREKSRYGGRGKPPAWFDKPVRSAISTGTIAADHVQRDAPQKTKSRQQLAAETWANVPDIEGV
ncbi:DUF1376 domain-containing protein [Acetobacter sp. P1H12_c]|uniref:YdaU family protein n=1 Tax=Acetobacter sp. P1H12_c TaxID=2762621 RepID=UPI001C045395|nr:DUF1376 domain-containing protein [Acetobacter sp. P1H12_c]